MPERPICRHFGSCGGCSLQDLSDDTYSVYKRSLIERALARHGVNAPVGELVRVEAGSRRRADFKATKISGSVLLGFFARASHTIVDMRECLVLTPNLVGLAAELRKMMREVLDEGTSAEIHVAETKSGVDVALRCPRKMTAPRVAELAAWAAKLNLARVTANGEIVAASERPVVRIAESEVHIPPGAFLQPTRSGEQLLQALVCDALKDSRTVADLFAGCGTFSLALARRMRVHAVETDRAMLDALAEAARRSQGLKPLTIERRDLFKQPLSVRELERFDGLALDPPRAGAFAQAKHLARTRIRRIVYVSCDAESFARDARILVERGHRLACVTPVDQFLWSDNIELVGMFELSKNEKPPRS